MSSVEPGGGAFRRYKDFPDSPWWLNRPEDNLYRHERPLSVGKLSKMVKCNVAVGSDLFGRELTFLRLSHNKEDTKRACH